MRRIRDRDELEIAFTIQRRALAVSAEAYDQGETWEALRLATVVHTLVHDGGKNSVSLLGQIGVRGSMRFMASGRDISGSRNLVADTPLVMMSVDGGKTSYIPRFGNRLPEPERQLQAKRWWEEDLIFRSGGGGHRLTRKKLVFALRNQEGGSHFDAELRDPNYIEMSRGQTWTVVGEDGVEWDLRELEFATMRQVAWELTESMDRAGL